MADSEERSKRVEDALDEMRKLMQEWKNRLTTDNLRLAERYIDHQLEWH